jgi:hypothetical protein
VSYKGGKVAPPAHLCPKGAQQHVHTTSVSLRDARKSSHCRCVAWRTERHADDRCRATDHGAQHIDQLGPFSLEVGRVQHSPGPVGRWLPVSVTTIDLADTRIAEDLDVTRRACSALLPVVEEVDLGVLRRLDQLVVANRTASMETVDLVEGRLAPAASSHRPERLQTARQ